jgi:MtrB/PioB family decaheme-associated outer membrane protein
MRLNWIILGTALLSAPAPAAAQTAAPPSSSQQAPPQTPPVSAVGRIGEIDFGLRLTGGLDDVGRFHAYRDPTSGPTLSRLRYTRDREAWAFNAEFDNVGYRDQRYLAAFNRFGKVRGSFEWNQVPTWYSGVSQSPFRDELPGVFRLDDTLQQAVQNRTATLASYASELRAFDTRARRDIADARFAYSATRDLDLSVAYTTHARHGEQPWGASFGFSNANELPLTIDHRIHNVATAAEWSNARGMARVGYDGSWFNNGVEAVIWDNPLRFTDQTHASAYSTGDGSSRGRMALFPDSSSHTVSASGSIALPARSRAFGYVSVGRWIQDERLLPFTINTAIDPIPLPRETAEGDARVTAMNYRLTSRPLRMLWLSGQFRLYDFDNRTPHFPVDQYVRLDGNVATSVTGGSEPFAYTRHFVDLDASVTPFRFVAFRVGYGQEHDDRSYRYLEETTERIVRASIDTTGFPWGSIRLQYDHSVRTGEGFDEEVLDEIGEQVSLRQFDISDRDRDRVSAIFQINPWDALGFNVTTSIGQENRPDAAFGLQDNDMRSITFGVDVTPSDTFSAGGSYAFENYSTLQRSRQANPGAQFNDPTRDWATDMNEDVHTWTFTFGTQFTARAAFDASYDFVTGGAQYLYLLTENSTLAPPQQLPELQNRYHRASADFRYTLTERLALGAGYRLDKYSVDEFGRSPEILNTPLIPAFLNMLYQWRPYDVHTGTLRLIYRW